jgi:hypothetical protein
MSGGSGNRNLQTDRNFKKVETRVCRLITFNAALGIGLDYVDWIYVVQHWAIVEWPAVVKTVVNFEVPYKRASS